jgi:hypothetical protein
MGKMAASQRTCSKACGYKLRKLTTRTQRTCKHCHKLFWPIRQTRSGFTKFCSRQCYYDGTKPVFADAACITCGATVRRRAGRFTGRIAVCSRECQAAYFSGANHPLHRGDQDPNRGARWRQLAATIRLRDRFECQRCGKFESENGGKKLSVDHIVPWRLFEDKAAANDPDNLASLCHACHAHKTVYVEPRYLRGDMMAFAKYKAALFISRQRRSQNKDAA